MRRVGLFSLTALVCVFATAALDACGDKFLLVGRGLAFGRAYASIYPGAIVIFSGPRTAPEHEKLQQNIRRAGHRVSLVSDESALTQSVLLEQTDIIIADVAIKTTLDPRIAALQAKPSVLYLVSESDARPAAPVPADAPLLKNKEKAGRFLVVIEDIMKQRQQAGVRVKRG
jgi:hypothetical protein